MSIKITIEGISNRADALAAICALEAAFDLMTEADRMGVAVVSDPIALPKPVLSAAPCVVSALAQECQTIAAELDAADAGIFNAAELAADAVPAPPPFDVVALGAAVINPATLGFGTMAASVPPPPTQHAASAIPSHEAAGVPLDSSGLPHDPRIHAATRTTMKDGTWKKKPRVTDEEVATVTAELRGVMGIPAPAAAAYEMKTTEVFGHQITMPVPVPAPPQVSVAPVLGTPSTFPEFIAWVSPLVTSGKLTVLNVNAAALGLGLVNGSGVGSIQLLANRPDLVPAAYAALSAQVAQ